MSIAGSPLRRSWVPPVVIVVTSLVVLAVLNPHLLVQANTPSGGDMGAHVFGPAYLRDTLIPSGRLMGWSNSWFAGFPAFYFYFPLPSIVIVLLDLLLPYGVAFKLVTVMGVVTLPPAVYFLTRSLGFSRQVGAVTAAGSAAFVFMESYSIYGGNIASTLAGEFAYSWSFSLGLVYLGYLVRAVSGERRAIPRAAAAFGLTALSHILTTLVLVFASFLLLAWRKADRRVALGIWVWAFAIAGFWALPLAARIGLTSDMAWSPLTRWEEVFPIEMWLLLPLAIAGAVWANRRTGAVLPLAGAMLLPLIYYPIPTVLPEFLPGVFGADVFKLWNGRLLPYWYFGVVFFASLAVGGFVMWATRRLPERVSPWWPRIYIALVGMVAIGLMIGASLPVWSMLVVGAVTAAGVAAAFMWRSDLPARSIVTGVAASVLCFGSLAGVTFIDGWARWNYTGYEGKTRWPEYEALMETVDELPPGRIQWEANRDLNEFGTPMALMLFPYWSEGHPSMEGLFFESSLTTPFHFLNAGEMSFRPSNPIPGLPYQTFDFDRGLSHLDHFGVTYYVAFTDEAKLEADGRTDFAEVAVSEPFKVYRLPPSQLVEVAVYQPAVYDPELGQTLEPAPSYDDIIVDWYEDTALLDRWLADDGPDSWPRIGSLVDLPDTPLAASGQVSNVEIEDHRIAFTTTAIGVPHLVKVSYFPNWHARGAEGPWRAAPSLMAVVPTEENVVLEFENTWAEYLGVIFTLGGVGALAIWRRRGMSLAEETANSQEPSQGARDSFE